MVVSALLKFLYPPPLSVLVSAMSVISFAALTNSGWNEVKGKHMQYAKLRNHGSSQPKVSGKLGMIVVYTPAFLAGVCSFFLYPTESSLRFTLLRCAVTAHFLKRILEVLLVHKFSGYMNVEEMIIISSSYLMASATTTYAQSFTVDLPEPALDLKLIGVALFLLGICGNFYHHYLLSKLRSKGSEKHQYKIPQGGLFGLVICPHYLFEIIGFYGISCISQAVYPLCFTLGTTFYLMGRSYATRKWYKSKFEDFPEDVKALIPYVF